MFHVQLSGELNIDDATTLIAALATILTAAPEIDVDLTPRHPMGLGLPYWIIRWAT